MAALDADNMTMLYSDGANSYQFDYNPRIRHWWEHIKEDVVLGNGIRKHYHRGYIFHAALSWSSSEFIKKAQYDSFRTIFNTHDDIIFNPAPVSASGATFGVYWENDFNFTLVTGVTPYGYEGTIELVGTSLYNAIPDTYSLGDG